MNIQKNPVRLLTYKKMYKSDKTKDKDLVVTVYYDIYSTNFRNDPERVKIGRFVMFHPKYNFSDNEELERFDNSFTAFNDFKKSVKGIYIPVYLKECNNAVSISTIPYYKCDNNGLVGYMYMTKDEILKSYNTNKITSNIKTQVTKELVEAVNNLNYWVTGDLYMYTITMNNKEVAREYGLYTPDEALMSAIHTCEYSFIC